MYDIVQDRVLNWWNHGDQERPCLLVYGWRKPDTSATEPIQSITPEEYWLKPESHLDRAIRCIAGTRYFGEAVPYHYVDFGASALCGMQGCGINCASHDTIWVDAMYGSLKDALGAAIDGGLPFSRCVRESFEYVSARLKGKALVGPYCIGSPCDNLAGLIGTNSFLYTLYDEPELLEQALHRQLGLWMEEFSFIRSVMQPSATAPMTGWHGIPAPGSTFPIQEDISYMLGTEHYNRFCMPGIRAMVESMEYPFFHLDGAGALKHLPALLGISGLKVIQWQPGEGHMRVEQWYDVVRKILASGKSCQLYVRPEEVSPLIANVGTKGLLLIVYTGEDEALHLADRYKLNENLAGEGLKR